TGFPVSFERYAASIAASPASLRPYEPGPMTQTPRTFSCGSPNSLATPSRVECGFCEPVQIVASPSRTSATAHAGPMQECDCNDHSYSASTTRAADLNAASMSPFFSASSRLRTG